MDTMLLPGRDYPLLSSPDHTCPKCEREGVLVRTCQTLQAVTYSFECWCGHNWQEEVALEPLRLKPVGVSLA